jgi:phage-related protein
MASAAYLVWLVYSIHMATLSNLLTQILNFLVNLVTITINFFISVLELVLHFVQTIAGIGK